MNYQAHYDKLVARAQARIYSPDVYVERHHIVPRCMGGSNSKSNIVKLLPEEHLFAHRLLCRIFPEHRGLAYAVVKLCGERRGAHARRLYAADRKRYSQSRKGMSYSTEMRHKISLANKGLKRSAEVCARIAAGKMGHVPTKETMTCPLWPYH